MTKEMLLALHREHRLDLPTRHSELKPNLMGWLFKEAEKQHLMRYVEMKSRPEISVKDVRLCDNL